MMDNYGGRRLLRLHLIFFRQVNTDPLRLQELKQFHLIFKARAGRIPETEA
jgi:hypothetical protein